MSRNIWHTSLLSDKVEIHLKSMKVSVFKCKGNIVVVKVSSLVACYNQNYFQTLGLFLNCFKSLAFITPLLPSCKSSTSAFELKCFVTFLMKFYFWPYRDRLNNMKKQQNLWTVNSLKNISISFDWLDMFIITKYYVHV
jgi:hypothetical protein